MSTFDPSICVPNPDKEKCSHTTLAGKPCNAWAIRGSDPPTCAIHAKLTGGGAPKGNQNARKHGFYSNQFTAEEAAKLLEVQEQEGLEDEIVLTRIQLYRIANYTKHMLEEAESNNRLPSLRDLSTAIRLHNDTLKALATATRMSGPGRSFGDIIDEVLEELSAEWDTDL